MSKLYIFGIGGTGSRVLRSLTMLLSAGVQCDVDTIVPIIIDRDESNSDLTRTTTLIDNYVVLSKKANAGNNKFFNTKIERLKGGLILTLKDNTQKFDEFIGLDTMSQENKALIQMLFSKETLDLDMSAGFQGNPNIGSVVLNQFSDSDVFRDFANSFQDGDKIFIISSIFGGTGASGFPLLRKVLQTPNMKDSNGSTLPNWGLINNANIGALSVLPYFKVQAAKKTDDSLVDSDTFTDKARAALSYYKQEDKNIDTLYYIGDNNPSTYEHNKGGVGQKNNAHFVEMVSALAILDFVQKEKASDNFKRNQNNDIIATTYKEFGINKNSTSITFEDLERETRELIVNPLSQFFLFSKYIKEHFKTQRKKQPYARQFKKTIPEKGAFYETLEELQNDFLKWLYEMENDKHSRKFSPFYLDSGHAFDAIKKINVEADYGNFKSWSKIDNELNALRSKKAIKSLQDSEEKLLELFYAMSNNLINYKQ